jgi:hypothetical protein
MLDINSMDNCPTCRKEISIFAKQCPGCGRPKPFLFFRTRTEIPCTHCNSEGYELIGKRPGVAGLITKCRECGGTKKAIEEGYDWFSDNDDITYLLDTIEIVEV